jgi:hypothetical protein
VTTSMITPPLSIWARPFLVVQVDVATVTSVLPLIYAAGFANGAAAAVCLGGLQLSHGACRTQPHRSGTSYTMTIVAVRTWDSSCTFV